MLKLPDTDLFKSSLNRPSSIKDRRKPNVNAPLGEIYYKPGPEDGDEFIPPYSTMEKFTKEQRREFIKLHGRAKVTIEKREPLRRMSKFDEIHSSRQSYFSEQTAKCHKMKEFQFKNFYHPHYGIYRYGNGKKLCSIYQKPELLGVSSVAVSRDGKDVVVGFGNGDFKLWDRENQVVMCVEPHDRRGRITKIKFFGDPFLKFLACNRSGEVYLFKLKGLKPPKKISLEEPSSEVVARARQASHSYARSLRMADRYSDLRVTNTEEKAVRLEAETQIIDSELDKQMKVKPYPFAVATWECYRFSTERGNEIETLDIDPTETKVITAGQDASIRLYDIKTRKVVSTFYGYNQDCNKTFVRPWNTGTLGGEGHYMRVYAATFSTSRENIFITGGLDGVLKIWDVRCQSSCRNIVGPVVCGDTVDSMGNTIAVGQWAKDGRVILIDMRTEAHHTLKPMNRWHGGGFPHSLRYFKNAHEAGGKADDLLLVGGSGYLEVVSISEEEILCGFHDPGHIVSIDNNKSLIFSASTEHAFNLHEYFPNIFREESEETVDRSDLGTKEKEEPEVPHARIKDIKKLKRTKAPQDSVLRQVKKLMVKSCRKVYLTKEEKVEYSKKEEEDISDSSLVNIPLTSRKSLKVKAIILDKIADMQLKKMIKKIRKKEMNRAEKKTMKKELMKVQGRFQAEGDESSGSSILLL